DYFSNVEGKDSKSGKDPHQVGPSSSQMSSSNQVSPSNQVPPTSPLDKTRGLSDSERDGDFIDSTQMQEAEEDILQFTKELNNKDKATKEYSASSPVP
ncbi:hypothetical protein L7F22_002093, partial [Adiantum nelumboides]|nr:hypothetical protein [Adiantum nelumboides]